MNIGLVVARIGSKGISKKNIKDLGGKPLINWVINEARKSKLLNEIFISTDSQEIVDKINNKNELLIPYLRRKELSTDKSLIIDTIFDCLMYYKKLNVFVEKIILLQPTSPFTIAEDIDNSIKLMDSTNADTVITAYKANQIHPSIMFSSNKLKEVKWITKDEKMTRRQDLNEVYIRSGNVYTIKSETILKRKIYGKKIRYYEVPKIRSLGIDDLNDFKYAEFLIQNTNLMNLI
jgi:N-acylneuraminate cytidylyltransferase/CMP-N,N'-diacetyllegionaminic acid synthase